MQSNPRKRAFTLIEVMIGVLIFSILLAVALPNLIRSRAQSRAKACSRSLKVIDGAKEMFALDNRKNSIDSVAWTDLVGPTLYLKSTPVCPANGAYTLNNVGTDPSCDGSTVAYKHSITGQ